VGVRSANHAAFGRNLAAARHRKGLSQEALGLEAGLHRTYVSAIERGQQNPSLTNIIKLAREVGVPPAELFGGIE